MLKYELTRYLAVLEIPETEHENKRKAGSRMKSEKGHRVNRNIKHVKS